MSIPKHKPSWLLKLTVRLSIGILAASPLVYKWVQMGKEQAKIETEFPNLSNGYHSEELSNLITLKESKDITLGLAVGTFFVSTLIAHFFLIRSKYRFARRSYLRTLPGNQFDAEGSYPRLTGGRKPCHWEVFRKAACLAYDQIHDGSSDDELRDLYRNLPAMGAYTWSRTNMQWKLTEKSPENLQPQCLDLFREFKRRFTSPDGECLYYIRPTHYQGLIIPSLVAERRITPKISIRFHFSLNFTSTAGVMTSYLYLSGYLEKPNRFYPQKGWGGQSQRGISFPCPYDSWYVDTEEFWRVNELKSYGVVDNTQIYFKEIRKIVERVYGSFGFSNDNVPSRPEAGGGTGSTSSTDEVEEDELPLQVEGHADKSLTENETPFIIPPEFADLGIAFEPDGAFAVMGLSGNQDTAFQNLAIGGITLDKEAGEGKPVRIAKGGSTLSGTFADGKWTVNVAAL